MATKVCARCYLSKPLARFALNRYAHDGYQAWCHDCQVARRRERKRERAALAIEQGALPPGAGGWGPPTRRPEPRQYAALFRTQDGRCAICCEPEAIRDAAGEVLPLVYYFGAHGDVVVRALLCRLCNFGLQAFRDMPAFLGRAHALLTGSLGTLRTARAHIADHSEVTC